MISLKCTVCGGDVIPNGDVGVCESCGRKVALAGLSDERRIENRNRANEARLKQDYSSAERAWSRVVADEPDSAEAHWNLAISRYGIDYVWDEMMGEFHPVMNRVRFERFTDDPDYRAAVQQADENGLVYYLEEGERLEALRDRLLALVKDEPGYDVFLCGGGAGADSGERYLAEIYRELCAKGLRVFYGREALAGILKQEQEPYVFSALYTSRVMVLFASAAEQLSDVSVKNEWSRFLALAKEDERKYLIPAYAHMRPEFFPDEIPGREAIDMTAGGSMMDLVRGVLRLAGKGNADGSFADPLRIKQVMAGALREKNFREAVRLGREGTEIAPDDADLWYYLFLAENRISSETEFSEKTINWMDSRSFTRAYELATRQRRTVLDKVKESWENYQQRLLEDRELAEAEKAARAKSAETAANARTMMMKGYYQEAFRLLSDNVTVTEEIAELRDDAELGCEYAALDRENYLTDTLNREAPGSVKTFLSMSAPLRKGPLLPWNAVISLVGAIMMAMHYYSGFTNGTVEYGTNNILRIFGPAVFILGIVSGLIGSVWYGLLGGSIGILIIDALHFIFMPFIVEELFAKSTKTLYLMLALAFVALAVVAVHDIPCQSKGRRKRCMKYYGRVIAPEEKKHMEAYGKKYERLTNYAPLGELTTVWDKYKMSKESE